MTANLLLKQFINGRFKSFRTQYSKVFGSQSYKNINKVIPNLSGNLFKSTESFIEAVISQDIEFVQQTATLALKKRLIPAMEELKANHIEIKQVSLKQEQLGFLKINIREQMFQRRISPYVIFGQKMEERLKLSSPWANTNRIISFNRYLYQDQVERLNWQKIKNNHIYGFNCHYETAEIQIIEGSKVETYPSKQLVVTFETDADNLQFYVADFNYFVKHVIP